MLESHSWLTAKPEDIKPWSPDFTLNVLTLFDEGLILQIPQWIFASFQVGSKTPSYLSGPYQGAIGSEPLGLRKPPDCHFVFTLDFK